ncbi:MAG: 23S rRNA (uracil(1939)-C(5))-methyltransferase RlmD [Clostridia bacterium]|nr:23S rRNA (uracil(1939)-C(5))-methyltransferase RlmD [Clostridia bacterium]
MRKNEIVRLTIEEINNLGCGVGHIGGNERERGIVVFVRDAVTGDELDVRIIKVNKSYLVGKIEKIIVPSSLRCVPDCNAQGCGGCVYRHVDYAHELDLKRDYVVSAFRKAGLPDVEVETVRHTDKLTGYRNKAQYPVCNGKNGIEAGFFATASHRIVPATDCKLQPPIFGEIVSFICDFCTRHKINAYEETTGKGLLRHIYLRMGAETGEVMVCLVINAEGFPREGELAEALCAKFDAVKSVMLNVNRKNTNVVLGKDYRLLAGREWIEDRLCGHTFRISAGAFYQVNHDACELLYGIAKERAALTGKETLLDLYCGIGTIGLSMADSAGEVIGIEIVDEAVERAGENAKRNGIEHASFYCGDASDAKKLLENAERKRGTLDPKNTVVVFDPPRKGSTSELINYISDRGFNRVVYVSCNPDTLARDCVIFEKLGYEIGVVTPVDMFPRTGHVESVVCLTRS